MLPKKYKGHQDKLRQMKVRKSDCWVATFPRSGTTWTQELVWMINNNLDYEKAKEKELSNKYNFIEFFALLSDKAKEEMASIEELKDIDLGEHEGEGYLLAEKMESPRFIKTHQPFSLLPPFLLHQAKVVYVARDPRDVAVSFYYHNKFFKVHAYRGDFKTYWSLFINDLVLWAPYFAHLKEAWALRHHPNMLFLFYEELSMDLKKTIRRLCKFYNKNYTEEEIQRLCEHVQFDKMRTNKTIVPDWMVHSAVVDIRDENGFVRKGKVGGWQEHFDEEMTRQADKWIQDNLKGTDILFPHFTLNPSQLSAM